MVQWWTGILITEAHFLPSSMYCKEINTYTYLHTHTHTHTDDGPVLRKNIRVRKFYF
jgi:hypothetical protein